ncbi:MAG: hypothetical protein GY861_03380 [bacterium]|nr:hypothetical protein [bacterium]
MKTLEQHLAKLRQEYKAKPFKRKWILEHVKRLKRMYGNAVKPYTRKKPPQTLKEKVQDSLL